MLPVTQFLQLKAELARGQPLLKGCRLQPCLEPPSQWRWPLGLPTWGKPRPPPALPSIIPRQGAQGPPPPCKKHSIPRNVSGPAVQNCCSNIENQPGARSRPRRPNQSPKRRVPVPRNDAQQRCRAGNAQQKKTEPLWRSRDHLPSRKKGEHLALGRWRGIFFFFFPLFSAARAHSSPPQGRTRSRAPAMPPARRNVPSTRCRCTPHHLIPDVSGSFPSQTQVWIPFQSPPVQPCIFPVD